MDVTAAALVRGIVGGPTETGGRRVSVALAQLSPAPWQPRRDYDAAEIAALAESIRRDGLLQPLLVRPIKVREESYQVVFGHRRLEALQLIAREDGTDEAVYRTWAQVRTCTDLEARILTTSENLHRKELSPFEVALDVLGVKTALADAGHSHTDRALAGIFNRSHGTIAEYRVIATEITEQALRKAGFVVESGDGASTDWQTVGCLTKSELHTAARSASTEAALRALRAKASGGVVSARSVHGVSDCRPGELLPRFSVGALRSRGDFAVKLSKPFESYSRTDSIRYLKKLLPAVAALAMNIDGESGVRLSGEFDELFVFVKQGEGGASVDDRLQVQLKVVGRPLVLYPSARRIDGCW